MSVEQQQLTERRRGSTTPAMKRSHRPRTFAERQPYMWGFSAAISTVTPIASAYQICRLYKLPIVHGAATATAAATGTASSTLLTATAPPRPGVPLARLARMSLAIFPHQVVLKAAQLNASCYVKDILSPWMAFGVLGVLQGFVYGHCNVHFARELSLGTRRPLSFRGVVRGSGFAGVRDMISQGLPFMCSEAIHKRVLDPMFPTPAAGTPAAELADSTKRWSAVLGTSVLATYLSQSLHNFQVAMQTDQSLSYAQSVRSVLAQHGRAAFWQGAEARIGLLLAMNVLNELLLKPAWAPVPIGGAPPA